MNLKTVFDNLEYREGIYFSDEIGEISYPEDGSAQCYQVEDSSFWFVHRNKCILALIEQFLTKDDVFLDVGGGNGYVSRAIQEAGYSCALIEPFLVGCINAKKRGLNYIINGVPGGVDIPEHSFDAIGIFDVLEHIEDRPAFLGELRKLLKPGGKLFITVPAFQKLWSYEDELAGHFLRYSRSVLNDELQQAGFRNKFSSYLFSWLVPPVALMRTLPYKMGKRQQAEASQDHASAKGMQKLLAFEIARMKKLKPVRFGSSVIAVFELA